ncbi:MAG: hypothetical protein R3F30_15050 [Planctomycetota bacterium]
MRTLLLICCAALVPLQGGGVGTKAGAAADEDLEAFLQELPRRLRSPDAPDRVDAYEAKATFRTYADGNAVDVEATIWYQDPSSLREEIRDGKKEFVRGVHGRRAWMVQDERAYDLQGREYAEDRRALRRDLTLAGLTARYLHPERELRRLDRVKGPTEKRVKRRTRDGVVEVPVLEVEGIAKDPKDYPLSLTEDHEGPILVTVVFDKATFEPAGIRLQPLDPKTLAPLPFREEAVDFASYGDFDGLRLPHELTFRQADPEHESATLRVASTVAIREFRIPRQPIPDERFRKPALAGKPEVPKDSKQPR